MRSSSCATDRGTGRWTESRSTGRRHEVIKDLGGLRMIEEAVLPLQSLSTKPYTIHKVDRTTIFVWNKGRRVYELHGPDGSTWVMQSWSQQIDPKLGVKDLPGLGKRLKLPTGLALQQRPAQADAPRGDGQHRRAGDAGRSRQHVLA